MGFLVVFWWVSKGLFRFAAFTDSPLYSRALPKNCLKRHSARNNKLSTNTIMATKQLNNMQHMQAGWFQVFLFQETNSHHLRCNVNDVMSTFWTRPAGLPTPNHWSLWNKKTSVWLSLLCLSNRPTYTQMQPPQRYSNSQYSPQKAEGPNHLRVQLKSKGQRHKGRQEVWKTLKKTKVCSIRTLRYTVLNIEFTKPKAHLRSLETNRSPKPPANTAQALQVTLRAR